MNFAEIIYKHMPYAIGWIKELGRTPEDVWYVSIVAPDARETPGYSTGVVVTLFFVGGDVCAKVFEF